MFIYNKENDEYDEVFDEVTFRKRFSVSSLKSYRHSIKGGLAPSRIITKSGRINVFQNKIPQKYANYMRDLGNTLLNIRWRWIITTLFAINVLSFFLFGIMWMFVAYISGDFDKNSKEICIVNTRSFTGYLLLSIETMLTIGYGYRYPTEHCSQGWIVLFLQALISIGIQGILVSAIYVKITKPNTKNYMGLFSEKAVICMRESKLCLIFRVVDIFEKIAIGTSIKVYYVDKNGLTFDLQKIQIQDFGFSIFPLEIVHVIDSKSPFWKLSPQEFLTYPIEVIVVAEGVSSITGQPSQNRISYINSNILWGYRFEPCVYFDNKKEKFVINCKKINCVYALDTPLCSAFELDKIAQEFGIEELNVEPPNLLT